MFARCHCSFGGCLRSQGSVPRECGYKRLEFLADFVKGFAGQIFEVEVNDAKVGNHGWIGSDARQTVFTQADATDDYAGIDGGDAGRHQRMMAGKRPFALEFAQCLNELDAFFNSVDAIGVLSVCVGLGIDLGETPAGVRCPASYRDAHPAQPAFRRLDSA